MGGVVGSVSAVGIGAKNCCYLALVKGFPDAHDLV